MTFTSLAHGQVEYSDGDREELLEDELVAYLGTLHFTSLDTRAYHSFGSLLKLARRIPCRDPDVRLAVHAVLHSMRIYHFATKTFVYHMHTMHLQLTHDQQRVSTHTHIWRFDFAGKK